MFDEVFGDAEYMIGGTTVGPVGILGVLVFIVEVVGVGIVVEEEVVSEAVYSSL